MGVALVIRICVRALGGRMLPSGNIWIFRPSESVLVHSGGKSEASEV